MTDLDQNNTRETTSIGHRIVRGAFVIGFMWMFWKFGGFLMNQVVYYFYGEGVIFDVFTAVYRRIIYLFFFSSLLQVVQPAFMPLFAERRHKQGEQKAWDLANTIINLLLIAAVGIGAICFIYTPEIVSAQLHGFSAERQVAAATLLRWMIPGVIVIAFAIAALAILTSYKIFSYPSAADAAQKFVWAAALFVTLGLFRFSKEAADAPRLIGITFLAGCIAQAAVLLFGMRKQLHLYRPGLPALPWRRIKNETLWLLAMAVVFALVTWVLGQASALPPEHIAHLKPGDSQFAVVTALMLIACLYTITLWRRAQQGRGIMGRFALLTVPLLISVIFARYSNFVETRFQSDLKYGAFGTVEQARILALMPTVLFAYALSIVMIPFLADLAARGRRKELGALTGRTLRFMALFFIPLAVIVVILAEPAMRLVWDYRAGWSPQEARQAALALMLLSLIIPVLAIENVITQSFFSIQQTAIPAITGIVFALTQAAALFIAQHIPALRPHTLVIVCAAEPIRRVLKNLVLILFLRTRLTLARKGELLPFCVQLAIICAATAAAAWLAYAGITRALPLEKFLPHSGANKAKLVYAGILAIRLGLPSLAALIAFIALCLALKIEEFRLILDWARPRLARVTTRLRKGK